MLEDFDLLDSLDLTDEEKEILKSKITEEPEEKKEPSKGKQQSEELKNRIEQSNLNNSVKEKAEILSFLKSRNGGNQFSKEHLLTLNSYEILNIYNECSAFMPEAMKKAETECAKAKAEGKIIFENFDNSKDNKKGTDSEEKLEDKVEEQPKEEIKEEVPEDKEQENVTEEKTPIDKQKTETEKKTEPKSSKIEDTQPVGTTVHNTPDDLLETIEPTSEQLRQVDEIEEEVREFVDKGAEFTYDDGKGREKVTVVSEALDTLKSIVDSKAGRACLIAGGGIIALTVGWPVFSVILSKVVLAIITLGGTPLKAGLLAGAAYAGYQIHKGRKAAK